MAAKQQVIDVAAMNRLIGEANGMERREQEVAAAIAGEQSASAIAAVRRRREADDQQPRTAIAEPRQRAAPVVLIAVLAAFLARDLFAVRDESRTEAAVDDRALELLPRIGAAGHFRTDSN